MQLMGLQCIILKTRIPIHNTTRFSVPSIPARFSLSSCLSEWQTSSACTGGSHCFSLRTPPSAWGRRHSSGYRSSQSARVHAGRERRWGRLERGPALLQRSSYILLDLCPILVDSLVEFVRVALKNHNSRCMSPSPYLSAPSCLCSAQGLPRSSMPTKSALARRSASRSCVRVRLCNHDHMTFVAPGNVLCKRLCVHALLRRSEALPRFVSMSQLHLGRWKNVWW